MQSVSPPASRSSQQETPSDRKQRVLTHGTASTTRPIADAVVLKDGDLFLVTQPDGRLPRGTEHGFGLYYHDCRYVRQYEFRIQGALPSPLGGGAADGFRGTIQLTNPELHSDGREDIPRDTLGIAWHRTLDRQGPTLRDEISFRNWGHTTVELPLEFRFAAGFEDVFQIRGSLEERLGTQEPPEWRGNTLYVLYHGLDGRDRRLTVKLPEDLIPSGDLTAAGTIRLPPRGDRQLSLSLKLSEETRENDRGHSGVSRMSPPWPGPIARVTSDSLALNEILHRSFQDLQLLQSTLRGQSFIASGIPWFAALFGRDSLVAALQLLPYSSAIARETLRLLASYQGDRVDRWRDEEPGKILHELRVGEMAATGEIPQSPYYGTVDATPLFLMVLARYVAWTGDLALFDELRDHVRLALEWIDRYGDSDGDGYVEYSSASEHGLINQGWKDSGDAMVDQRGRIAEPPIALVEVQAYVYAAKLGVAELYERRNDRHTA
jgi:glycogen debranching enzyme